MNCPAEENEYDDVENVAIQTNNTETDSVVTTTVKVNGQEVIVNETSKPTKTQKKSKLTINEHGIIIKTK